MKFGSYTPDAGRWAELQVLLEQSTSSLSSLELSQARTLRGAHVFLGMRS